MTAGAARNAPISAAERRAMQLRTLTARIRALGRAGVGEAEIARRLGCAVRRVAVTLAGPEPAKRRLYGSGGCQTVTKIDRRGGAPEFRFCGGAAVPGIPYCAACLPPALRARQCRALDGAAA